MPDQLKHPQQRLVITDRKILTLNGVINVVDFSGKSMTLKTEQGLIIIDGNDLKIENLVSDSGEILVNGEIDGFYYKTDTAKKSFLEKLFK